MSAANVAYGLESPGVSGPHRCEVHHIYAGSGKGKLFIGTSLFPRRPGHFHF
jgi:hypothetical protein